MADAAEDGRVCDDGIRVGRSDGGGGLVVVGGELNPVAECLEAFAVLLQAELRTLLDGQPDAALTARERRLGGDADDGGLVGGHVAAAGEEEEERSGTGEGAHEHCLRNQQRQACRAEAIRVAEAATGRNFAAVGGAAPSLPASEALEGGGRSGLSVPSCRSCRRGWSSGLDITAVGRPCRLARGRGRRGCGSPGR